MVFVTVTAMVFVLVAQQNVPAHAVEHVSLVMGNV